MRPSRQVIPSGNTVVFMLDYLSSANIGIQVVPTGGASVLIMFTADDPNDATVTPTWITMPAPFNVAVTANTFGNVSLFPIRAIQIAVTVSGSAAIIVLQSSGTADLGPDIT